MRVVLVWLIRGLLADVDSTVATAASIVHTKTTETISRGLLNISIVYQKKYAAKAVRL